MSRRIQQMLLFAFIATLAVPDQADAGWGLFSRLRCFRARPVCQCPPTPCPPSRTKIVMSPQMEMPPPTEGAPSDMSPPQQSIQLLQGWKIVAGGFDQNGNECTHESECCPTIFGAYLCLEMMHSGCEFEYYSMEMCSYEVAAPCCNGETPLPDPIPTARALSAPGIDVKPATVVCWRGFFADGNCPFQPATCAYPDLETTLRQLERFVQRCDRPGRKYQIRKI